MSEKRRHPVNERGKMVQSERREVDDPVLRHDPTDSDKSDYSGRIKYLFLATIILSLGFSAFHLTRAPVDPDELQHLHAAWLWGQNVPPYTGFFEHHAPAYWLLLRPIVRTESKDLVSLVQEARFLSWVLGGLLVAASWRFFAVLFGPNAAWSGTTFVAAHLAFSACLTQVRPDTAALLALIAGTTLSLEGLGLGKDRASSTWRAMTGGALLATAICFHTKSLVWIFFLGIGLVVQGLQHEERKAGSRLASLGLIGLGAMIPLGLALGWALCCNELLLIWKDTFRINAPLVGAVLKNLQALGGTWQAALSWPVLSAPLAILGAASVLSAEIPRIKKVVSILLVAASILIVLIGVGPFAQNHLHLQFLVAGLAGAGVALGLDALSEQRARFRAVAGLLMLIGSLEVLVVGFTNSGEPSPLALSLQPFQFVLNNSKPGDTFQGILQWNPVLMMDADPQTNALLVCTFDQASMNQIQHAIDTKHPRFIVGYGQRTWTSGGRIETAMVPPAVMTTYQQIDPSDPIILVRR